MRRILLALAPALAGCVVPATTCDEPGGLCLSAETAMRTHTGLGAGALASVDLDGDGERDLVAAGAGTLTVVWGRDAGLSGDATTWSIDKEVAGVAVADLDGDGRLDLATALPRADAVAVLRGRGGRSFEPPARIPAGASPRALIAADLDGTAPAELITADLVDGTITVVKNLVAGPPEVVGSGPRALAAGDLDGDGDLDLAVALADADAVQVMHGDGRGGLFAGPRHPVGAAPRALALADLDDDGALDIAAVDALDDTISVLYADGAGGHRERTILPTAALPTALAAVTDTGRAVLAVLSESTGTIAQVDPRDGQVLVGNLRDAPSALVSGGPGELRHGAAIGRFGALAPGLGLHVSDLWSDPDSLSAWPVDVDGDGIDEIVQAAGPTLSLRRDGTVVITDIDSGLSQNLITGVRAIDLSGDGLRDLLLWNYKETVVLVQQPDGASFVAGPPLTIDSRLQLVSGDIDGDGAPELLVPEDGQGSTRLRWWTSDPVGALTELPEHEVVVQLSVAAVAVVDGDGNGRLDLALAGAPGQLLYLADASSPARPLALGPGWTDVTEVADLDGDGNLDAVGCTSTGLALRRNLLDPTPSASERLGHERCESVTVADLDGDGALDLLERSDLRTFTKRIYLIPHLRRGGRWEQLGITSIGFTDFPFLAVAQLDGDGVPDLLSLIPDEGVQAHRLTLGPALVEADTASFGSFRRPCLGDLDGDGAIDLVVVGGELGVAFGDRRGGFEPLHRRDLRDMFGPGAPSVGACALADFDADGSDELVLALRDASEYDAALLTIEVARDRMTIRQPFAFPSDGIDTLVATDGDGDGALDLLAAGDSASLSTFFYRGDGAGGFLDPVPSTATAPAGIMAPQFVDVDADGRLDVVAQTDSSWLMLFPGEGAGAFADGRLLSPLQTDRYTLGDVDGDARTDLAAINVESSLLLATPGIDRPPRVLLDDVIAVASADLDRDGRLELLAAGPRLFEEAGAGALYLGRRHDDGRLAFTAQDLPVADLTELRTADVDGDGMLDIVLLDWEGLTIVRQAP